MMRGGVAWAAERVDTPAAFVSKAVVNRFHSHDEISRPRDREFLFLSTSWFYLCLF
jgi:hypothetical protein